VKKRFAAPRRMSPSAGLLITSMADVFMILLVFMLKSYSTSLSTLTASAATRLPLAISETPVKDAIKIEVSRGQILVDQKRAVTLDGFTTARGPGAIREGVSRLLAAERSRGEGPATGSALVLLADEKAPYDTLAPIFTAAAETGFVDVQLVVVRRE